VARSAAEQLGTARIILAQLHTQIEEWEGMNRERRRTPHGRDLGNRIDGLRELRLTWATRAAELEQLVKEETPDE
jgi:hypothetical protein